MIYKAKSKTQGAIATNIELLPLKQGLSFGFVSTLCESLEIDATQIDVPSSLFQL